MGFSDTIHDNLFKYDVDDDVVITDEEKQKILYDVKHYKETGFYGEEFKWGEICEWIANSDISNLKKVGMILDHPIPFKKEWWSMDYWKVKCQIMKMTQDQIIKTINEQKEEIEELKKQNTTNKDWEVIAKDKTKILQKYLPDYNPVFYPGSDSDNIEGCFKKLIKKYEEISNTLNSENDRLEEENEKYIKRYCEEECEISKLKEEVKELLMKEYKNEELEEEIEQKEEEIKDLREKCAFANDSENVFFAMYEVLDTWKLLEDGTPKFMEMWDIVVKTLLKFKEDNKKLNTEVAELRLLVDKNTNVVEYLNSQIDKHKSTLQKVKTECDKVKGISINQDKTKITINGVELVIGDKFSMSNEVGIFELKEIYVGKSGKYSLRTDYKTIRLGNKFITGSVKISKE